MLLSTSKEQRKEYATLLTDLLYTDSDDKELKASLIRKLGYEEEDVISHTSESDLLVDGTVGIYKREGEGRTAVFSRNVDEKDRWSYFADIHSIPAVGDKRRVVFLGESVGRGFLLDPDYTPSIVLEYQLNQLAGREEYEVIDLAETNLGLPELLRRYRQCYQLHPDMIVFLAGNNWRYELLRAIEGKPDVYQRLVRALQENEQMQSVGKMIEDIFADVVTGFLETVGRLSRENNVPVIFAIPEFNLLDCRSTQAEQYISTLHGEGIDEWVTCKIVAEKAFAAHDLTTCIANAQRMIALDCTHPSGYELLADCWLQQGKYEEARACLENAKDTALYFRTDSKPRIFNIIRETILSKAAENNVHILDIKAVFDTYQNGRLPGRELFLDYCHFTVEGIQVAMNAVSNRLFNIDKGTDHPPMVVKSPEAKAITRGLGHLFAAIHNAHWGQSYEILYYHCCKALENYKQVARLMVYYCDMMSRKTANNLCKSLEMILKSSEYNLDRYVHALLPPRNKKSLETELVSAMVDALKTVQIDLTKYVREIRVAEHNQKDDPTNLLLPFYCLSSYEEFQGSNNAFYQARNYRSVFKVVGTGGHTLKIDVELRVPYQTQATAKALLYMNDAPVTELEVTNDWVRYELEIPAGKLHNEVNELSVHWPLPGELPLKPKERTRTLSLLDNMFFVFGEISLLNVRFNS